MNAPNTSTQVLTREEKQELAGQYRLGAFVLEFADELEAAVLAKLPGMSATSALEAFVAHLKRCYTGDPRNHQQWPAFEAGFTAGARLSPAESAQPAATRQYFYRMPECTTKDAKSSHCICWHEIGTGPLNGREATATSWRDKPAAATPDFADAYEGAREDLAAWKKRALSAEARHRQSTETVRKLCAALNQQNGPMLMGEPAAATVPADEREAFEQAATSHALDVRRLPSGHGDGSECYVRSGTEYAWTGWQLARAALAAPAAPQDRNQIAAKLKSFHLHLDESTARFWTDTVLDAAAKASAPTPPAVQEAPSDAELIAFVGGDGGEEAASWQFDRTEMVRLCRTLLARYGQAAAASAEPVMRVRIVHKDGEVLDPVIGWTSASFDRLPHGTELELFAAPVAAQAPQDHPAFVIYTRPGMTPERKGPYPTKALVEAALRELQAAHPDATSSVISMPADCYPQSGVEWIDMCGDKRKGRLITAQAPAADGDALPDPLVQDMAMLIKRMCRANRYAEADSNVGRLHLEARKFLRRHGLSGSPLRSEGETR